MLGGDQIIRAKDRLSKIRLLLLAGGASSERGSSLTTRDALVPFLQQGCLSVEVVDPNDRDRLLRAIERCDFVLNVVYGRGGEDGAIQGFLDTLGVPYSGPSILPSAIGMNKEIFVSLLRDWGYPVPAGRLVSQLGHSAAWPDELEHASVLVLKPIDQGDSLGVQLLDGCVEADAAIGRIPDWERPRWRLEQFIEGPFGTIGVFQCGSELLVGDVVLFELPAGWRFYDSRLKLTLVDERAAPTQILGPAADRIREDARKLYKQFCCKGLVRFDFIYNNKCPVYLEMNTLPGLYPGSNIALSYKRLLSFDELLAVSIVAQLPNEQLSPIRHQADDRSSVCLRLGTTDSPGSAGVVG